MNNSSKTNTILLVILIIIALGIVFLQVSGKTIFPQKQNVVEEINEQKLPQNQVQNTEVNQPTVNQNTTQSNNNVVTLDTSSEAAKMYKTELTEALTKPANFNGHYVLIIVPVDAYLKFLLVDKNTGRAFNGPLDSQGKPVIFENTEVSKPPFSLNSNIVYIEPLNATYEFNGTNFIKK